MIIQELTLKNFRCFDERVIPFDGRVVVIEGPNGSGKSSILEALHYSCYLRSFRTHLNRELISLGQDYFFAKIKVAHHNAADIDNIHIGFSQAEGKVVTCNETTINSYKDLLSRVRVVTLAADDLELVQGSPELRRDFLNYALLLNYPDLTTLFKRFKQVLENRNSLLMTHRTNSDEFDIWTEKLWHESRALQEHRRDYLQRLEQSVNALLANYFLTSHDADLTVRFEYTPKNMSGDDFNTFWAGYRTKHGQTEQEWRRSLFGAHLDDFAVIFQNKKARVYASRGQQKLLVLLIKIAQLQQLSSSGEPGVLLLDDFMTDFDATKVERSVAALKDLQFQMFLSCPVSPDVFLRNLSPGDITHIRL